jgi:hypothetical protein
MAKKAFFALGVSNSILLILIFLLRGSHFAFIQSYGWVYLLLALPAIYVMSLVGSEQNSAQYRIFLGIFLAFLLLEGVLDFAWKVPFRDDWKLLTPYLALYYGMNYGFIVMPWKASRTQGILMLGLFIFQLGANFSTH